MALKKIGAFWKPNGQSKSVLSGRLDDGRKILVFKNDRKQPGEKYPDYTLHVVEDDQDGQAPAQDDPFAPGPSASAPESDEPPF